MDFLQATILGLVQGITEFLPVSSTGHLILVREWLGLPLVGTIAFDAVLQLATGIAIVCYFWRDLWNILVTRNWKLVGIIALATVPAIVAGLLLEDYMDSTLRTPTVVAVMLIVGAIVFYFAEKFSQKTSEKLSTLNVGTNRSERFSEVSLKKGFMIGLFQCIALIPGFSRSGATISGGLFNGLTREAAARFSFLLSIPIILGSGVKKLFDITHSTDFLQFESALILASLVAFISGILAIHFLLKFLKNHSLNYFGAYRIILAIVILVAVL
jgi:undecaprenyl-diphosphatase